MTRVIIITAQKMKFSMKDFFSKCDQISRELRILVKFTEEILNGKLHFLCTVYSSLLYLYNSSYMHIT